MNRTMDMTRGRITPHLLRFGAPLMLSSILQQLYSLCDSMVVGRLIGVEAFAAVGAASFLNWLPLSMVMALSHGFGAILAQRFGAGDENGLHKAWRTALLLSTAISLLLSMFGLMFLHPLLTAMRTPAEMLEYAARYLRVMFAGLICPALYNLAADYLRAAGDSRTPLNALVISTILNIVLDYILVAFFDMSVEGVALATVLAQLISLIICLVQLRKPLTLPPPTGEPLRGSACIPLLKLGLPPMFRDCVIAIGGLFVQSAINGFGVTFVAGMTAARRYFSMMEMCGSALEGATATFVGQNAGAGKTDRVHRGTRTAAQLALLTSLLTAALAAVFARPLIALLITESNPEVIRIGVTALRTIALFLPALYLLCLYRASLQSMGDSITPMLSGFAELAMRLLCVLTLANPLGRTAAYIADGTGWVAAMILLMSVYYSRKKHSKSQ